MNALSAIGLMVLGVLLLIIILAISVWYRERKKHNPPFFLRDVTRWLWLMNKYPLRVWSESGKSHKFTWQNWDMGYGHIKVTDYSVYPEEGDLIIVDGKYGRQIVLLISEIIGPNIHTVYLGNYYGNR